MKYFVLLAFATLTCAKGNILPRNCDDILIQAGRNQVNSGIYTIYPTNTTRRGAQVFCDMETSGGGWVVIQRRRETDAVPQLDFFRYWADYVEGFGALQDSHWLGLDLISLITNAGRYQLRIDLTDWEGEERFAEYEFFQVSNSSDNFRLTVNGYNGTAGDSLLYHDGMQFSTKDKDNDGSSTWHCAMVYHGAWWYRDCIYSNLNGEYGQLENNHGIIWLAWHGDNYSYRRAEMKIRSVNEN